MDAHMHADTFKGRCKDVNLHCREYVRRVK